jgi:transposase
MSTVAPLDRIGVGIDTARYGHRVSFLRPDLQQAAKPLTVTENRASYLKLQDRLDQLHRQHPQAQLLVRIDAAGQYAANLEQFLRDLKLPITISIGEPRRNRNYQLAHFPKRVTDDTESLAMARFAVVEVHNATPAPSQPMALLREIGGRLQAKVKQTTQAINRLHNALARSFPELATLTDDISTSWVLKLLQEFPTADCIANAPLASLEAIPYLSITQAKAIQEAAEQSVATLRGSVAKALVRELVADVRHCQRAEKRLRKLLASNFAKLPNSPHVQVGTVPGIGKTTAAILVAKIVQIERFATPDKLVNYFGVFPEEARSGVDKQGKARPAGSMQMSRKGNDMVRYYLWNAARSAIRCNPAIRALYRRLKARGTRGDVALGRCMQKLLHLVFAVWTTDRPFDEKHFDWGNPTKPKSPPPTPAGPSPSPMSPSNDKAVGHKGDLPPRKVVTTAYSTVEPTPPAVKPTTQPSSEARPRVDFAFLREQVTMEQVLGHLGLLSHLRGRGDQRRGPCPVHSHPADSQRTFSVHLVKNAFRCFQVDCAAQGNVLDLWAAVHRLPLYEAAVHLAEIFHVPRNREEEPVPRTRRS